MALKDFITDFGLDLELIYRDREICAGMARAREGLLRDIPYDDADLRYIHSMAAATDYRRAGAHSLLLSDRQAASEMFERAGYLYARLKKRYALMMVSCAYGALDSIMAIAHDFGLAQGVERTQISYLILASAAGADHRDRENLARFSQSIESTQNAPIGMLGIPVGAYLDVANALTNEAASPRRLTETLLPFLVPYSMALRRCMENTYHWERWHFHSTLPNPTSLGFCSA